MPRAALHCFASGGRHYALDPETCFCFECDAISRDVLEHYPHTPVNRIVHLLQDRYPAKEIEEVVGELEWLRGAKSIVQTPRMGDLEKLYTPPPKHALRRLSIAWRGSEDIQGAQQLLLARSGNEESVTVEFLCGARVEAPEALVRIAGKFAEAIALAGRQSKWEWRCAPAWKRLPSALEAHRIEVVLHSSKPFDSGAARAFNKAVESGTLESVQKWTQSLGEGYTARVVLLPEHGAFGGAAKALRDIGFAHIELDADAAFVAEPKADIAAVFDSLRQNAEYYSEALLNRDLFRLDPIAGLFLRIYQGSPRNRSDLSGTHALAVDSDGAVYPSRHFLQMRALKLGNCFAGGAEAKLDEGILADFENLGSVTTAPCTVCWARNLCGGGSAAVHHALTGSVRTPHPDWSAGQRGWLEAAIAAFNKLSTAGVNFTQVYESLGRKPKVSLWQAARTLMNVPLGLRPLAEGDAPMLARWENWNGAAYFTVHEAGALTTSQYDREMDAVHPHGFEQEFILTSTRGDARGLLRIRPMLTPGLATAWFYLHNAEDYQAPAMRKGFRNLLGLLPAQQDIRRLLVPAGPHDGALPLFLQSAGFAPAGVQRQALFLHGAYHDVQWYTMDLGTAS
jgi:radical SAM protein with 4Fe4S-binding SPASM domain